MRRNQCSVAVMYTQHTSICVSVKSICDGLFVNENVIFVVVVVVVDADGLSIHLLGHILQSISHDVPFISQFSKKYWPSINNDNNDNNKRNQAESNIELNLGDLSSKTHITYTLSIKLHNVSLSADALTPIHFLSLACAARISLVLSAWPLSAINCVCFRQI